MNRLFKFFRYLVLLNKKREIEKRLKKLTRNSKIPLTQGVELSINAGTREIVEQVNENVKTIVKQTECNPVKLLEYIKATNTPVYVIKNTSLLKQIHEDEGLICEQKGFDAIFLSIITGHGISLHTPPMFVLGSGNLEKYHMLHNFYRWFAMKSNLPGFDYKTQKKFKRYLSTSGDVTVSMGLDEINSLQEAIARDNEATEFVLNYEKETETSKKVVEKIKDGGANI